VSARACLFVCACLCVLVCVRACILAVLCRTPWYIHDMITRILSCIARANSAYLAAADTRPGCQVHHRRSQQPVSPQPAPFPPFSLAPLLSGPIPRRSDCFHPPLHFRLKFYPPYSPASTAHGRSLPSPVGPARPISASGCRGHPPCGKLSRTQFSSSLFF
jgi:hypothetical protein